MLSFESVSLIGVSSWFEIITFVHIPSHIDIPNLVCLKPKPENSMPEFFLSGLVLARTKQF